jgi:ATP synthase F1 delta subunit
MAKDVQEYISLYISDSMQDLRDLLALLEKEKSLDKKQVLSLAKTVNPGKRFVDFVEKLIDEDALQSLPELLKFFDQKLAKKLNLARLEVLIRTAKPLDQKSVDAIVSAIEKKYERKALVKTEVDQNLLGGIVVKVNDKMVDLSYRTQMNKLKNIVS